MGKMSATRMLLHRFTRMPEDIPQGFQLPRLDAILIGKRLEQVARAQLSKKIIGGFLVGCWRFLIARLHRRPHGPFLLTSLSRQSALCYGLSVSLPLSHLFETCIRIRFSTPDPLTN